MGRGSRIAIVGRLPNVLTFALFEGTWKTFGKPSEGRLLCVGKPTHSSMNMKATIARSLPGRHAYVG
jgi:hypothetical protein